MPSSSPKKRKQASRKKEYTQQEKDSNLRDSLFKGLMGMAGPGLERMLKIPAPVVGTATTDNLDASLILHELESIKLYLFDITKRLDRIELFTAQSSGNAPPTMMFGKLEPNPFDKDAMYKGPNKNKGQEFVRKNIAQILKNMIPPHYMDALPPEVRAAYNNILGVMAPPNDPIWDKESKPDPREPLRQGEAWSFKDIGDYWNSIAEGTKKIDHMGADIVDEAIKGANEALIDDDDDAFGLESTKKDKAEEKDKNEESSSK